MKVIVLFLVTLFLFLVSTRETQAIIVVVPVVLVPVVKIVALIIGALATPVVSLSAWYLKLKNKSILFGILFGVITLITLGISIAFGIKIINPNRPLY